MRREAPERGERGVDVAPQLQGVEPAVEGVEFGPACGGEDPSGADALIGGLGAIMPAPHPGPVARSLRNGVAWAYVKLTGSTSTWDPIRVRLDSLFWRHISGISVRYPRAIRDDAGDVLLRFPHLTSFQLEDSGHVADWAQLCREFP